MTSENPTSGAIDSTPCVIGVDVGTGSARAGIFDLAGRMMASAKRDITLFHAGGSIVEQSSGEIWSAVCHAVKDALSQASVSPDQIAGIGFDATCSLVVLGEGGQPLPVGPSEQAERDIIVWMDHRAVEQAQRINATGPRGAEICRRQDLAGNGDAEAAVAPRKQAEHLRGGMAVLRSDRLPDLARDRRPVPIHLHGHLQMDLSGARNGAGTRVTFGVVGLGVLADEAFARIGQTIVDPGNAVGKRTDGESRRAASACEPERRSPRA